MRPYATIAERGAERVLSPEVSRAWSDSGNGGGGAGPLVMQPIDIKLGNQTIERLVFEGVNLNIRRGNLQDVRR